MASGQMVHENIWCDKWRFDDAERNYYEKQSRPDVEEPLEISNNGQRFDSDLETCEPVNKQEERAGLGSLATQIAKARQEIQESLCKDNVSQTSSTPSNSTCCPDVLKRVTNLESDNAILKKTVKCLEENIEILRKRMDELSVGGKPTVLSTPTPTPAPAPVQDDEEEDDDVDLFGSDDEEEDADAARIKEERLQAYAEKKSKKPGPIAKSSILLDCKPWDDETDMKEMERIVRTIEMDGLVWGAARLQPLAFGIMKLSILCTIEDEKVSVDDLSEKITEFEDLVQSVDIAAFNKV